MGVWIGMGLFSCISLVLFCCVRVGARADKEMEKLFQKDEYIKNWRHKMVLKDEMDIIGTKRSKT